MFLTKVMHIYIYIFLWKDICIYCTDQGAYQPYYISQDKIFAMYGNSIQILNFKYRAEKENIPSFNLNWLFLIYYLNTYSCFWYYCQFLSLIDPNLAVTGSFTLLFFLNVHALVTFFSLSLNFFPSFIEIYLTYNTVQL